MVTRRKDLRTGRSIWERGRAPPLPHRPLTRDLETDVLVIGAGITGAMIADALAPSGMRVVLVDRRGPAKGSTTASTALVQHEIDMPLTLLARRIGPDKAARAWRRSRLAVEAIAARLGELDVQDVTRRDALYLPGDVLDARGLEREHHARRAAGLPSRFLTRKELRDRFGIAKGAGLLGYGDLAIDPRRATLALLQAAVRNGTRIFAPTEIIDIDSRKRGATATAANGRRIRARHVVFATGYELPDCVPRDGHKIVSTWAIATPPQKRRLWPEQCMIWEAAQPYLYLRTTGDGRVICGGEDEDFSDEDARDALLPAKTRTLQKKLRRLLPRLDTTADFAWCGTFGASRTGLPTIGRIPRMPCCWAALGYGGNGTTYARIAADVIAGALTGHPDRDADLYRFG